MNQPKLHKAESVLISEDSSILTAIRVIDSGAMQIAIVVDEDQRLVGIVTDGDIRRSILRGASVDGPVGPILNREPVTVRPSAAIGDLTRLMNADRRILRAPALDMEGRVVGVFMIEDIVPQETNVTPVVLMAGGMGQRLRPLTASRPKPMVDLGGKPILQRIIENFRDQGFSEFHISIGYLGDQIVAHFGDGARLGIRIRYVRETERLGTAGALRLMAKPLDRPFIVMNGDLVTTANFRNLAFYHRDTEAMATMCVREHRIQVPYGVVMQENGRLLDLREKPMISNYINAGIYMLNPEVLSHVPESGYFDMTSLFELLIASHPAHTTTFPLREYWRDIGTPDDLRIVAEELLVAEELRAREPT